MSHWEFVVHGKPTSPARHTPPTIVTKNVRRIVEFLDELGGEGVIKPLGGCGGGGVFHLRRDDTNLMSLLETGTKEGTEYVLVQRYLPEVRKGDKRIIVELPATRVA